MRSSITGGNPAMLTPDQKDALDALKLKFEKAESGEEHADLCLREAEIMTLVSLYDDPDGDPYAVDVPLIECFPDDPEECRAAFNALRLQGQFWCGGGAAQAVFIAMGSR